MNWAIRVIKTVFVKNAASVMILLMCNLGLHFACTATGRNTN